MPAIGFDRRHSEDPAAFGCPQMESRDASRPCGADSQEVSANSADPSLNSLEQHLDRDADGNWQGFVPGPETDHIGTTLILACHASISTLTAFGHLVATRKTTRGDEVNIVPAENAPARPICGYCGMFGARLPA
jgi:hypothetical protein